MVGDRGVDMSAAKLHGLHGLGALWGYGSREELLDAGAQDLVESPAALRTKLIRARAA
jgi:phosphoglycolate phosphatase